MALSNFWRRILYIAFNRDQFVFLDENLGHLTIIAEKQHLNYLPVGSISLHNLETFVTFVEPYLIILMSVRLERIYPCLLTYYDHIWPIRVTLSIHNIKIRRLSHLGYFITEKWENVR